MPVLGYHFPARSAPGISIEQLAELPIAGLKDSSGNAERLIPEVAAYDGPVWVGSSALLALAGTLGATGAILALANTDPELCISAFEGDLEAQRELIPAHLEIRTDPPHGSSAVSPAPAGPRPPCAAPSRSPADRAGQALLERLPDVDARLLRVAVDLRQLLVGEVEAARAPRRSARAARRCWRRSARRSRAGRAAPRRARAGRASGRARGDLVERAHAREVLLAEQSRLEACRRAPRASPPGCRPGSGRSAGPGPAARRRSQPTPSSLEDVEQPVLDPAVEQRVGRLVDQQRRAQLAQDPRRLARCARPSRRRCRRRAPCPGAPRCRARPSSPRAACPGRSGASRRCRRSRGPCGRRLWSRLASRYLREPHSP